MMSRCVPRTLEALLLHALPPAAAELLTQKLEHADAAAAVTGTPPVRCCLQTMLLHICVSCSCFVTRLLHGCYTAMTRSQVNTHSTILSRTSVYYMPVYSSDSVLCLDWAKV